jgi:hypothetical protein
MNVIIKMKKHPIDDIFAKKLAEHRQEPSQKAFEKFQARLGEKQQKRRGGFFVINRNWTYYAAAAGIVAALTIGVLSQQDTADSSNLASVNIPNKVENSNSNLPKSLDSQVVIANNTTNASIESGIEISVQTSLKRNEITPIINNELSIAEVETEPKKQINIIDDSPEEQTSVAVNTIFTTPLTDVTQPNESKTEDVVKNNTDESIVLVLEPEQIEAEVIPAISQDSETSLADAKRLGAEKEENEKSFIAKLYDEYKHFKYGEKVDLKKIGVKDALARVDEKFLKEERDDVIGFVQRKVGRLQRRD